MHPCHDNPVHEPGLDSILFICSDSFVGRVDWEEETNGGAAYV
jgi:hypothetical protein